MLCGLFQEAKSFKSCLVLFCSCVFFSPFSIAITFGKSEPILELLAEHEISLLIDMKMPKLVSREIFMLRDA